MEVSILNALGTVGAGGGGIVGLYLLGRGLWRLWSGQIEEQRLLLKDARESRQDIAEERDGLREELRISRDRCAEIEESMRRTMDELRNDLHNAHVKRRLWAEAYSELRRTAIESGIPASELPTFPTSPLTGPTAQVSRQDSPSEG